MVVKFKKGDWSKVIAILALVLSGVAIWQSHLARRDVAKINKMDFRPELVVHAELQKVGRRPPHISLTNKGPVDAVQVQATLYVLSYVPEIKEIIGLKSASNLMWKLDKIPPLKTIPLKLTESRLASYVMPVSEENKITEILELRLTYRRDVDLRPYSASTFYFRNQDGRWVNERSSSLDPKVYGPMKESLSTRLRFQFRPAFEDILHEAPPHHD